MGIKIVEVVFRASSTTTTTLDQFDKILQLTGVHKFALFSDREQLDGWLTRGQDDPSLSSGGRRRDENEEKEDEYPGVG